MGEDQPIVCKRVAFSHSVDLLRSNRPQLWATSLYPIDGVCETQQKITFCGIRHYAV